MAAAQIESKYQWYRSNGYWNYEPIKVTRRVADGTVDAAPDKPGHIAVPVTWGRYRLEVTNADPQGPQTTYGFDSGFYAEASADTPDLLEIALDKPEYKPGDTMTVAVTARSAGKVTLSVIGDRLITTDHDRCAAWAGQAAAHGRRGLGHWRLCARHAQASARRGREAHAGPRHRRAVVRHRQGGAHASTFRSTCPS